MTCGCKPGTTRCTGDKIATCNDKGDGWDITGCMNGGACCAGCEVAVCPSSGDLCPVCPTSETP